VSTLEVTAMSESEQGRDPLEEMREQLASVPAGDLIAEASLSLVALAYVRLGVPPEEHERYRDLEAARLLIDALGGMLAAVEGRVGAAEPGLRDALARLRMTYVEVANRVQAGDAPAGDAAQAPQPQPEGPGIYRPSGLWVPGRD
jgi:Domain of unknown function (DUF1844)